MQALMLYMSGGGVQIFSIGIVFMLLLSPLKNIAGINQGVPFTIYSIYTLRTEFCIPKAFAQFAPSHSDPRSITTLPLHKLVYILCNLLTLGVGLWKCRSMGLLPIGTGDWLAFETRAPVCHLQIFQVSNVDASSSPQKCHYFESGKIKLHEGAASLCPVGGC